MKRFFLICLLVLAVLFSGCLDTKNISDFAKTVPEINAFLAKNPNAKATVVFLTKETTKATIIDIRKDCGEEITEAAYWKIIFSDGTNTATVFLDDRAKQAVCIIAPSISSQNKCSTNNQCNDNNAETKDECVGTPKDCVHSKIVECVAGDNYCPVVCNYSTDADCAAPIACDSNAACNDNNSITKDICNLDNGNCLHVSCSGTVPTEQCSITNGAGTKTANCVNGEWNYDSTTCTNITCDSGYQLDTDQTSCVSNTNNCTESTIQNCTVEHGTGKKIKPCDNNSFGNWTDCINISCDVGYQIDSSGACKSATCAGTVSQDCTITNGVGKQYLPCDNNNLGTWGSCNFVSCNTGYKLIGLNTCAPKNCAGAATDYCIVPNGVGQITRSCINGNWTNWSDCNVVSCNSGFSLVGASCVSVSPTCATQNGTTCATNEKCSTSFIPASDTSYCCPGTCSYKTCSEQSGASCSNAQNCSSWLSTSDQNNCCSEACTTSTVTAGTQLACTSISTASYSGTLSSSQWFSIIPSDTETGGWGQLKSTGWQDYSPAYSVAKNVSLMPSDNLLITNNYAGGTLTITCDGTNKTITIPAFTDIFGDGFIVGAKFFDSKLFVGDDGTVYLNSDLTVKAS